MDRTKNEATIPAPQNARRRAMFLHKKVKKVVCVNTLGDSKTFWVGD